MPMHINGLWRVSWYEPTERITRVLFDMKSNGHYFLGNVPREYGDAKVDEIYRLILEPAFPHEIQPARPR